MQTGIINQDAFGIVDDDGKPIQPYLNIVAGKGDK